MGKAGRRGNGEGTTYRVKGDRRRPWVAVLVVGWTPEGRPIRRARFASSERAAKAMLADMRAATAAGVPLPDDRLTVGKWVVGWLPRQTHLRASTRQLYDRAIRAILPELGNIPLRRLAPAQVAGMLARVDAGPHWSATIRSVLSTALKDAMREGLVERNAASLTRMPVGTREQIPAPDAATVRAALAATADHRLAALYVLLAASGLRLGEALALHWHDVDGDRVTVRYTLSRDGNEYVLAEPKTTTSRRTVVLPAVATTALERHGRLQRAERLRAGRRWLDRGLVFTTAIGEAVAPSTAEYILDRACRDAGVAHLSPHALRRFAATVIAGTGDMKAAQTVLGHRSATLTADVYASPTEPSLRRAADALQEAIG